MSKRTAAAHGIADEDSSDMRHSRANYGRVSAAVEHNAQQHRKKTRGTVSTAAEHKAQRTLTQKAQWTRKRETQSAVVETEREVCSRQAHLGR